MDAFNLQTVARMYSQLTTVDHRTTCTISDTWHDIHMWIDIKFLELTKEKKIKYPGYSTCICCECQKVKGVKNIKKIHTIRGYPIPENSRFQWAKNNLRRAKRYYKFEL